MIKTEHRPECPQCGSQRIKDRWVKKSEKIKVEPITLEDYAKQLIERWGDGVNACAGDIHMAQLSDYSQLVLTCEDCGLTRIFDVPERVPQKADLTIPIEAILVWCRNPEVCEDAAPCGKAECKFKEKKEDIVAGIQKCHRYALTLRSVNWECAPHLPEETKIFFG